MPRAPSLWLSTVSAATSPANPLSIGTGLPEHRNGDRPHDSTGLPQAISRAISDAAA
jgi:hypothetical protein